MSNRPEQSDTRDTGETSLWWRAALPGLLVGAIAVSLGLTGILSPGGSGGWIAIGAGGASCTGALGVRFKSRALRRSLRDPLAANVLQAALLGDFVLQVFVVGIGATAMHLSDLKFEFTAGFAVAFAAVALAHQAGSALVLSRTLRLRAQHARQPADGRIDARALPAQAAPGPARVTATNSTTTPSASTHA